MNMLPITWYTNTDLPAVQQIIRADSDNINIELGAGRVYDKLDLKMEYYNLTTWILSALILQ